MPFQEGNKYGKGRPTGSQNKLTKANKNFLHNLLFNEEQLLKDFNELDLNGRMELRIKLAPYILPKAGTEEERYPDGPLFIDELDDDDTNIFAKMSKRLGVTYNDPIDSDDIRILNEKKWESDYKQYLINKVKY